MSKEQQLQLDAILRQGGLDTTADVQTMRAAFSELMAQVPVAPDVRQQPVEVGGVAGVEVTIEGNEAESVILYFHGGVYVIGSAASTVPLVGDLVEANGRQGHHARLPAGSRTPLSGRGRGRSSRLRRPARIRVSPLPRSCSRVSLREAGLAWRRSSPFGMPVCPCRRVRT